MRLQRQSNKQIITIDSKLTVGHGGEARVFVLPQDDQLVAKVYHKPTKAQAHKLVAMLANPPENPTAAKGHISIAWPTELLYPGDGSDRVIGFLMPRVHKMHSILEFYNPKTRRQTCPFFNYLYLHRTARNLVTAMGALHSRGYCIGDINESNILVSDTALVTLVDTDSFQVPDHKSGYVYRCGVGKAEFTPPELQGKNFAHFERKPEHDLFGLAVLLFQLLMEGTHPFAGIYQGIGDPPSFSARINAGHFVYSQSKRVPYVPTPIAPPFELLHPTLQQLFLRCFEEGHHNPKARPHAQAWQAALIEAEKSLTTCTSNNQHRYSNHLSSCPWCERAVKLGGRDQFPSIQAVRAGQHLQPVKRKRVTLPKKDYQQQVLSAFNTAAANSKPKLIGSKRKQKFNPLMWGLIGTGALVCLEIIVIVHDLQISPQTISNLFPDRSEAQPAVPQPSLNGNQISIAYYDQGNFHYKLGDYKGAIENFNRALLYNPNDANAYVNRGNARYEIAQHSSNPVMEYQAAIADFDQALQLNPSAEEAYLSRGIVLHDTAKYNKDTEKKYLAAIRDFNQTVMLNPSNAKAYVKRGISYYKLAQNSKNIQHPGYQEALKDFNQALQLNNQEAEAYIKRGIIRYEIAQSSNNYNQDHSAALTDLKQAAKLFLEQGNVERYQEALSNICVVLENKCQSFLQNPEKFITSQVPMITPTPKQGNS
jgi:DNA-binding helix-hairpin-helix protein with protein kinase domain